jgi:hypothetical protein
VSVLSQAKFQDGLMYYESTRDTASHFFISYLPKGVYVFEYSVRVQLAGRYQVDGRRWQSLGIWRATLANARLRRAWRRGVDPEELARRYRAP